MDGVHATDLMKMVLFLLGLTHSKANSSEVEIPLHTHTAETDLSVFIKALIALLFKVQAQLWGPTTADLKQCLETFLTVKTGDWN